MLNSPSASGFFLMMEPESFSITVKHESSVLGGLRGSVGASGARSFPASPVSCWLPVSPSPSAPRPLGSTSPVPGRCSAMVFTPRQTAPHSLTPGTLPSYLCSTGVFYTIKTVSIKILGQKSIQNKISSMRYKYLASQISLSQH